MTIDCIPNQFRTTVKAIVEQSHKIVARKALAPIAFLCKSDDVLPIVLDFPDEHGKDFSSQMISVLAKEFHPEYIVFVSEAWILETTVEGNEKRITGQSLEHHPDRLDVIMYSLETKHGIWLGKSKITTHADNTRTAGVPEFIKPNHATGRFANLLVMNEVQ